MIEKVKGFHNEVEPSPVAHRKILKHAQIKVDEAWCAQSISRQTERTRGKWKGPAMLLVCAGQWIDGSPAAECNDWRDLDVSQDLADEDVALTSRSLLFFFTKGKIK